MADTNKKGLALLLLGGKPKKAADKPTEGEPATDDSVQGPSEARLSAAQGLIDAMNQGTGDAEAMDEALAAWVDAYNAGTKPELDD